MENSYELTEGQDQQEHLLDDIEYTYTQARSGKRFANYLIDRVAFWPEIARPHGRLDNFQ